MTPLFFIHSYAKLFNIMKDKNLVELNELEEIKFSLKKECPFMPLGKLIRSKIGILTLKMFGQEYNETYKNILSACELIHNASLLHDDIIDESKTRRGESAYRICKSNSLSVIQGDRLLCKSLQKITTLNSLEIINIFNNTIMKMCDGELIQQQNKHIIPSIDDYINICKLKTASLFSMIFSSLTIISKEQIPKITENFGEYFGIAFQIQNDIKDIITNKNDITCGIYTAPVIFSNGTNITDEAIEKTHSLADNYIEKALELLNFGEDNIYKKELIRITKCLKK